MYFSTQTACLAPPYVENADITFPKTTDDPSNMNSVQYSCKPGYVTRDESVSMTLNCEASSGWEDNSLPTCVKGYCG